MVNYKNKSNSYDCFIFTHIPKCGGTSFRELVYNSALQSGINANQVYVPGFGELKNDKNFDQLNEDEKVALSKKSYKIIANHCKFEDHIHYNIKTESPFYFTILRDPIKRFISHYNFFYKKLGYNNCKGVSLNELKEETLDFLSDKLANIQINYIANVKMPKAVGDDNMLKIAIYNSIYNYGYIELLENQERMFKNLNKLIPEWLFIDNKLQYLNKNKDEETINSDVINKITLANRHDIILYNFIKDRNENLAL